jgi:hypothetical protein
MNGGSDSRSLICALRGPLTLITLGVLFALNNFTPWGFQQTWPVLLIVFGLLSLMRRAVTPPRPYPAGPAAPPPYQAAPPYTPPYTPPSPGGSYKQSQYGEPAPGQNAGQGPAKGGFGSSKTSGPGTGQNPEGAK